MDIPNGINNKSGNPAAQGTSGSWPVAKADSVIFISTFDQVSPEGNVILAVYWPDCVTCPELEVSSWSWPRLFLSPTYTETYWLLVNPDHVHVAVPCVELVSVMVIVPLPLALVIWITEGAWGSPRVLGADMLRADFVTWFTGAEAMDEPPDPKSRALVTPTDAMMRQIAVNFIRTVPFVGLFTIHWPPIPCVVTNPL